MRSASNRKLPKREVSNRFINSQKVPQIRNILVDFKLFKNSSGYCVSTWLSLGVVQKHLARLE
jgi:hypothetical protein